MKDPVRWGILGTGRIAGRFAAAIQGTPEANLVAVGSRTAASAAAFADRFGIPLSQVDIVHGDTDKVPFGMGTYGSRSLAVGGSAIIG